MSELPEATCARYFRTDTRKLTVSECWRLSPNPLVGVFFVATRLLRVRLPAAEATPWIVGLPRVPVSSFSADQLARLESPLRDLRALGFETCFSYTGHALGPASEAAVAMLDGDRRIHASIVDVDNGSTDPRARIVRTYVSLFSTVDGRVLVTTDAPYELETHPELDTVHATGDAGVLLRTHAERMQALERDSYRTAPAVEPFDPERLEAFIVSLNQRFVEFNAERGVLVPLDASEVEALRVRLHAPPPTRTVGLKAVFVWMLVIIALVVLLNLQ